MKKLIYSSLFAMLLLLSCQNQTKTEPTTTTDTITTATVSAAVDEKKIYEITSVDSPATYPGGISEFYKFIGNNLKYPDTAKKNNVQGSVLVSFIIEDDGTLADIKVEKELGSGTDEEAVRVLKLSKKWNPASIDGKPVRVKYNLPVKFSLAK